MRRCEACGSSLEGRRKTARFCDSSCRTRYVRGHRATPVAAGADIAVQVFTALIDGGPEPVDGATELLSLEDVARELQAALRSRSTPPSAKAALSREYRATLVDIARHVPKAKGRIDQLAERRAQRASG